MRLSDLDPAYAMFTRDLLARSGFEPERFHLEIAPEDEMFFKGVLPGYPGQPGAAFFNYVQSALRTFHVYEQLARNLGGFEALGPVLDFGSGHGRLTRTLRHRLPREAIWVADIYPHAVAWQAETFGVNAVVSVSDPDRFALPLAFSIVFAGSVFSHLPDALFRRWLKRLYALVARRGLLAFSVHDASYAPAGQTIDPHGFGYADWSESNSLTGGVYGMSYVTSDYVSGVVRETCGESASLAAFPCALFENQDLYVVGGEELDVSDLRISARPLAGFDKFGRADRPWSGWGVDPNADGQIVSIDLFVDGAHSAAVAPTAGAREVARFFRGMPNAPVSWRFEPAVLDREALARVDLTSSTGAVGSCYGRTLSTPGPGAPRT